MDSRRVRTGKVAIPSRPDAPLPVAISECLTGSAVRYDGSDARSRFPHGAFDGLLSWVPICPEVGIGMSVPRPPIQLVGDPQAPRVLGVQDRNVDVTRPLREYARARSAELAGVFGYVFMERSPSCGLYSVPVHAPGKREPISRAGRGAYAQAVCSRHPWLPVEENGRLFDAALRESFLARVFAYAHWRRLGEAGLTPARLMEFHSRYKYLLMAHSIDHYRQAGRLLGNADWCAPQPDAAALAVGGAAQRPDLVGERYLGCLMAGLTKPATRGGHANVLSHLQGYVSRRLTAAERRELAELIQDYRCGGAPLAEPIGLLLRHLAAHPDAYLADQAYLQRPSAHPHRVNCQLEA